MRAVVEATAVVPFGGTTRFKSFPPGMGHIKVPITSRGAAASALTLYAACRPRAVWMHRFALAAIGVAGARALPGRAMPWEPPMGADPWRELLAEWSARFGRFDDFAIGERSQRSRTGFSVLLLAQGRPRAFVKLRRGDHDALHAEGVVIQRMARFQPRSFTVPEPLGWGSVDEWGYLATAALPSPRHRIPESPPFGTLGAEIDLALRALPRPPETPGHWRPMHGDLTPWNLRQLPRGELVLFDWEDAAWAPPGADEVLYRASLTALGGPHSGPCPDNEAVNFWLARVSGRKERTERDSRLDRSLCLTLAGMRSARAVPGEALEAAVTRA